MVLQHFGWLGVIVFCVLIMVGSATAIRLALPGGFAPSAVVGHNPGPESAK